MPLVSNDAASMLRRASWDVHQPDAMAAFDQTARKLLEPVEEQIFELRHRLATVARLTMQIDDVDDWRAEITRLEAQERQTADALFASQLDAIDRWGNEFDTPVAPLPAVQVPQNRPAVLPLATAERRLPVREARDVLAAAVRGFATAALAFDPTSQIAPPVHAIRADLGLGKSTTAREIAAAELLATLRKRGDNRTVGIPVPRLDLAEEAAANFARMYTGWKVAVWRGREADDLSAPGLKMCRDLDRIETALAASADPQTSCCKSKTAKCPFFDSCGYQAQRHRKPDVMFGAHELMFTTKPAAFGKLAALIVDENPTKAALIGADKPALLSLDSLSVDGMEPGDVLHTHRSIALDVLHCAPDGPAQRTAWLEAGMTSDGAAEARTLERRRKVDAKMHPGMTRAEFLEAGRAAKGNATISRLARFWTAIEHLLRDDGPDASGWCALAWADTPEGRVRMLELKGRKQVRAGWLVPTLHINAMMDVNLVQPIWPSVVQTADIAAATPHMHIYQVTDRRYSKRHYELRDKMTDDERRLPTKHLRSLNGTLASLARAYAPGRTLAVTQLNVRNHLPDVGILPPTMSLAHFNALAGRDDYGDVAAAMIVGRTAPSPAAVERMAEALTGAAVVPLEGWYPATETTRLMTNGEHVPAMCDRHPNPIAEAIRWGACEGELMQAIGRPRGVNRTSANPVDVFVLTDVVLPIALTSTMLAADLEPTPGELMLATGGIDYANARHAATAYPKLWTRQAARQALLRAGQQGRSATNPYIALFIEECRTPPLPVATYKLAGPGQKSTTATYDPAVVLDVAAALAATLGPLASITVDADPAAIAPQPTAAPPVKQPSPPLAPEDEYRLPLERFGPTRPPEPPEEYRLPRKRPPGWRQQSTNPPPLPPAALIARLVSRPALPP